MVCTPMPGGGFACGPRPRLKVCACGSGQKATQLCDWKVPGGTCDTPLCRVCTHSPAPDKDLCPTHKAAWFQRQRA